MYPKQAEHLSTLDPVMRQLLIFRFLACAFLVTLCRLNETSLDLFFKTQMIDRVLKSRLGKQSFRDIS